MCDSTGNREHNSRPWRGINDQLIYNIQTLKVSKVFLVLVAGHNKSSLQVASNISDGALNVPVPYKTLWLYCKHVRSIDGTNKWIGSLNKASGYWEAHVCSNGRKIYTSRVVKSPVVSVKSYCLQNKNINESVFFFEHSMCTWENFWKLNVCTQTVKHHFFGI